MKTRKYLPVTYVDEDGVIWTKQQLTKIKEELLRYGVHHEISELGKDKADMGERDDLDNCFTYNNSIDIHKL